MDSRPIVPDSCFEQYTNTAAAIHRCLTAEMDNDAARHSYLGPDWDVSLHPSAAVVEGHVYTCPVIHRPRTLLFPGMKIPLIPMNGAEEAVMERLTKSGFGGRFVLSSVIAEREVLRIGCLAVVLSARSGSNRRISAIVAEGLYRVRVTEQRSDHTNRFSLAELVEFSLVQREAIPRIPKEIREGYGTAPSSMMHQFDPYALADKAFELAVGVLSMVKDLRNDPVRFSFWLAAVLPIDIGSRLKLYTEDVVSLRLRLEIELLTSLTGIYCSACHERLVEKIDSIDMSSEGPGGMFVNSHGHVHDLVTLRHVNRVSIQGRPRTQMSWFPGYAWTIIHCPSCVQHIGWRFTATRSGLSADAFWALTRSSITHLIEVSDPFGQSDIGD